MSQDDAFDILSNARRRYVLYYLREANRPVELGELAKELAAWENETTTEALTQQQRKRVYVSLYQTHIQKLADAEIVEYDKETSMVSLANGARDIGAYLSVGTDDTPQYRWQRFYLILAAVSGIFYTLVALDVSVFATVSEFQVGIAIVGAFAALAATHYLLTRRKSTEIPPDALIRDGL